MLLTVSDTLRERNMEREHTNKLTEFSSVAAGPMLFLFLSYGDEGGRIYFEAQKVL